jgi:pimeloyl-ACP methyl ester carboxylesterase
VRAVEAREPLALAYSDPRGRGHPIVFVHGFGHNRSVWEKLARDLPVGLRPISVDLRGHGESPWPPDADYGLLDYARDIERLLENLSLDRVVLVGHSLGGHVSTLVAESQPRRVEALVLVDSGPSLELDGVLHVVGEFGQALRSYASVAEYLELLKATHPNGDPEVVARLAETGLTRRIDGRFEPALDPGLYDASSALQASEASDASDVSDAGGDLQGQMAAVERALWAALRQLQCPVLLVRGGVSAILSEKVAAEMVDEVLRDGHLVTLDGAGHGVMIDDGPGLSLALCEFLSR